jgi:hypothetical protein
MQVIRHIGVGRSFWMPVAISGFFFFFGSIIAILFELNVTLTEYTDEVVQTSRLLGICILVGGVYSYSRKVIKNLGEQLVPEEKATAKADNGVEIEAAIAVPSETFHERLMQESSRKEPEHECQHKFGHLRTLGMNTPIPDECLSCDRIIECKHSSTKKAARAHVPSAKP